MVEKTWPALKPCTSQHCRASGGEVNDRNNQLLGENLLSSETRSDEASGGEMNGCRSQLPGEILLSSETQSDKSSGRELNDWLSRWESLWQYFPILKFEDEDGRVRREVLRTRKVDVRGRNNFVRWVNHVVDEHLAPALEEMRAAFDLDNSCQHHIDKWVVFALRKQVKTLELDLMSVLPQLRETRHCTSPLDLPHNLVHAERSLTSLCLKFLNVTAEQIELFLVSCPFLENLCIERSAYVACLRVSGSSLRLKHLEVFRCPNLKTIDISAPELMSFTYRGKSIELHVGCAPKLHKISIGGYYGQCIGYTSDWLSSYFSQLEYLTIHFSLSPEMNFGIGHVPALAKLKLP